MKYINITKAIQSRPFEQKQLYSPDKLITYFSIRVSLGLSFYTHVYLKNRKLDQ